MKYKILFFALFLFSCKRNFEHQAETPAISLDSSIIEKIRFELKGFKDFAQNSIYIDSIYSIVKFEDSLCLKSLNIRGYHFDLEIGSIIDGGIIVKNDLNKDVYVILKRTIPRVDFREDISHVFNSEFYNRPVDYLRISNSVLENKIQYILNNINIDVSKISSHRKSLDSFFKIALIESEIKYENIINLDSTSFNKIIDNKIKLRSKNSYDKNILLSLIDFKKHVNANMNNSTYFLYSFKEHVLLITINEQFKSEKLEKSFYDNIDAQPDRTIRIYKSYW